MTLTSDCPISCRRSAPATHVELGPTVQGHCSGSDIPGWKGSLPYVRTNVRMVRREAQVAFSMVIDEARF